MLKPIQAATISKTLETLTLFSETASYNIIKLINRINAGEVFSFPAPEKKPMELSIIYYMEIGFVSIQPSTIVSLGQLSINNYLILKSIIQFFRFLEETTIKSKRLSLNIKLGVSYAYLKLFQSLNYLLIFPMTKIQRN